MQHKGVTIVGHHKTNWSSEDVGKRVQFSRDHFSISNCISKNKQLKNEPIFSDPNHVGWFFKQSNVSGPLQAP